MLVVTIELYPHGRAKGKQVIAKAKIGNDGTGTESFGNYVYRMWDGKTIWRTGKLFKFPRLERNAWELLADILAYRGGRK